MNEKIHNGVSWAKYNKNKAKKPPSSLLIEAVNYVKDRGKALDFGAGALIDSKFLLDKGFSKVIAIDADPDSKERAKLIRRDSFEFKQQTFEDYVICPECYNLINAHNATAFISRKGFSRVMTNLLEGLCDDGVISINFFGDKDSWNKPDTLKNFLTKEEVKMLFNDCKIIRFEEIENDNDTALGKPKHWHIFNIIAKKI